MNNPKDLPFAAMSVAALYYISTVSPRWPYLPLGTAVKIALAIALALSIRVGGLLYLGYFGLLVMALPGSFRLFTVAHYLHGLVPHAMPADSTLSLLQSLFREVPTLGQRLIWLTIIEVTCLALAARSVARREYVLEQ